MSGLTLDEPTNEGSAGKQIRVTSFGETFDVTDFAERHPGGREILLQYSGQEVTELMKDEHKHKHSAAAYSILKKYRVVDITESRYPSDRCRRDAISKENDNTYEAINLDKAVVGQLHKLGNSYFDWVYDPIDEPIRMFDSIILELLSKSVWPMVPIVWIPIITLLLTWSYKSFHQVDAHSPINGLIITSSHMPVLYILGILSWTLVEYTLHRWLFHQEFSTKHNWLVKLHFVTHGIHHKTPMDKLRLVFPPLPAMVVSLISMTPYYILFPKAVAQAMVAGMLSGYTFYDLVHFYVHHGTPSIPYFKSLKTYHARHHYENHRLGYGIVTKLWDYPFNTQLRD